MKPPNTIVYSHDELEVTRSDILGTVLAREADENGEYASSVVQTIRANGPVARLLHIVEIGAVEFRWHSFSNRVEFVLFKASPLCVTSTLRLNFHQVSRFRLSPAGDVRPWVAMVFFIAV